MPAHSRQPGLDTLRALAIVLVFLYHYQVFVSHAPTFGWLGNVGWTGVDLFFVLSGYLIGHQVFAGVARGERLSLPAFYARRLLRTMPAFWAVLALYFVFPAVMGGTTSPPLWRFLTFTQNWGLQPGTAFSHAWSLCIEEQFYLVLPLVVLAAVRWRGSVAGVWALMALLTGLGLGARAWLWSLHGSEAGPTGTAGYHPWVYYATLCRFDEFLPGLAVALVRHAHPRTWVRWTAHGNAWLLAGTLAVAAMFWGVQTRYYVPGVGYGAFMTVAGYSLIAWAFALWVLAALSPGSWLQRVQVPGAAALAAWSYAIYLTHKAVAVIVARALAPWQWPLAAEVAVVTAACLAAGWLLYRAIERPVMRWRDRQVPTLFPRPALGAQCQAKGSAL